MKIQVRAPQIQWTEALRQHAVRRLQFALSRFSPNISLVTIDIRGVARTRGALPTRGICRITVHLLPEGIVQGEDGQNDLNAAIGLLSERAGRAVQRWLDRERSFRPHWR